MIDYHQVSAPDLDVTILCVLFSVFDIGKKAEILSLQCHVRCRRVLKGHTGKVLDMAWCSDKRKLVSSSQVKLIFFYK